MKVVLRQGGEFSLLVHLSSWEGLGSKRDPEKVGLSSSSTFLYHHLMLQRKQSGVVKVWYSVFNTVL